MLYTGFTQRHLILPGFVRIGDGLYLNVRVTAERGERAV
jgi:hypothetical protein